MIDTTKRTPKESSAVFGFVAQKPDTVQYPTVGARVGQLEILGLIASGGMAHLYKGHHRELEVVRAVKILKPNANNENFNRFLTEAKVAAHLHHPNIVQIHNVGMWKKALPYIEMEYVDGLSLADLLKERKRLPIPVALAVARIVCRALDFAGHQNMTVFKKEYHGLVHRDIKPANILINKAGTVKLVDFGIALPGSVSINTTEPGILGTFAYASPEQLSNEKLDCRTDVYSLGCVLYEMLTGDKCFSQSTIPELIQSKQNGRYIPLHTQVAGISQTVVELITKSLQIEKEKRFDDPASFSEAIDRAIKEYTEKTASVIVRTYIRNRESRTEFDLPSVAPYKSPFSSWVTYVISLLALGLPMVIIIWAFNHYTASTEESSGIPKKRIMDTIGTGLSAERFTEETVKAASSEPSSPPRPENPKKTSPLRKREPDILPARKTAKSAEKFAKSVEKSAVAPSEPQLDRLFHYKKGMDAFLNNDYTEAIEFFKSTDLTKLNGKEKRILKLRLFESYLNAGNFSEAQKLAEGPAIDDAYFHLVAGKVWYELKDYQKAETEFREAQGMRSVFGNAILQDAIFMWAQNRDKIYMKKPNVLNRESALRAWQSFQRAFCDELTAASRCAKADVRVKQLAR